MFGELKLVNCNISYWNFVRKIRNENQGFITYAKISIYTQILYMFKHAKNYKILNIDFFAIENEIAANATREGRSTSFLPKRSETCPRIGAETTPTPTNSPICTPTLNELKSRDSRR